MKSLVIAAHPDDETLGVAGSILRRKAEGHTTAWLIITGISIDNGWSADFIHKRQREIDFIQQLLKFDEVYHLDFPTAQLDTLPMSDLVSKISNVFNGYQPNEVFVPHYSDVHSDHRIVFQAVSSCCKWFRYPSVKRILCYETLSETDFGLGNEGFFKPNYFLDISTYLEVKIQALQIYSSEIGKFPFPRSIEAIHSQALVRGAASGYAAAEAFELLRERS